MNMQVLRHKHGSSLLSILNSELDMAEVIDRAELDLALEKNKDLSDLWVAFGDAYEALVDAWREIAIASTIEDILTKNSERQEAMFREEWERLPEAYRAELLAAGIAAPKQEAFHHA